jgi:hypothetical protein
MMNTVLGKETHFNNTWTNLERRRGAGDIEQIMLHNDKEYYVPLACTVAISNQPLICYPKFWNEFNEPCKLNDNKTTFKRELIKYFLDKLETNYVCERLLCFSSSLPLLPSVPHTQPPEG